MQEINVFCTEMWFSKFTHRYYKLEGFIKNIHSVLRASEINRISQSHSLSQKHHPEELTHNSEKYQIVLS